MADTVSDDDIRDAAQRVIDAANEKWNDFYLYSNFGSGFAGAGTSSGMSEKRKKEIKEATSGIKERFEQNLTPVPAHFDHLANTMAGVQAVYGMDDQNFGDGRLEAIDTAKGRMEDWQGAMKRNFVEKYLQPLPAIMANHGRVAAYLSLRAGDMKAIYEGRRRKTIEIADQTVTSIESLTETDDSVLKWLLPALISAGTAVVGLAPFLGPVAGRAVTVGGSSLIVGGTMGAPLSMNDSEAPEDVNVGEPASKREVSLEGSSVPEVLDKMREALNVLDEVTTEAEQRVSDDLNKTDNDILRFVMDRVPTTPAPGEEGNPLVPIRPLLVGADHEDVVSNDGGGLVPKT